MNSHAVTVQCDVHMIWTGPHPRYRVWVNDELFTERTWVWSEDYYLEEVIPIQATAGQYQVRYEVIDPAYATVKVRNWRTVVGPGVASSTSTTTAIVEVKEQI